MQSRVLVLGSKAEAEQNLEIAFRLLTDTQGGGGVAWRVVKVVTQVGVAHWGVALGVRLA